MAHDHLPFHRYQEQCTKLNNSRKCQFFDISYILKGINFGGVHNLRWQDESVGLPDVNEMSTEGVGGPSDDNVDRNEWWKVDLYKKLSLCNSNIIMFRGKC